MSNRRHLRYRHRTWAFAGFDWNFLADLLLGRTRGTEDSILKCHAHVSSPQVLGGVEDSSKNLKLALFRVENLYQNERETICSLTVGIIDQRAWYNRRIGTR